MFKTNVSVEISISEQPYEHERRVRAIEVLGCLPVGVAQITPDCLACPPRNLPNFDR